MTRSHLSHSSGDAELRWRASAPSCWRALRLRSWLAAGWV